MSVYELDLSGLRVTGVRLTMPLAGAWVADVALPDDTALPPGPLLTLSIGNLALVGAVVQQDSIAASREVRLVGGAGGWGAELPAAGYHDDAGVIRATVLRDLAALTGELIDPDDLALAQGDTLGVDYVREAAPASRTLEQLAGESWWVDPQGFTHVRPRPAGATVATPYLVEDYRGASGRLTASTEDYASWTPGAVLASPQLDQPVQLVDVTIATGADDRVRVEAIVVPVADALAGVSDRLLGVLRAIIRHELRALTFASVWEYQVSSAQVDATGRTLVDGLPLAPGATLPPLRSVEVRPGVPGFSCVPAPGSRCHVAFLNQDPSRPVVLGFDSSPPTSASLSSLPELLPPGAEIGRVVRYGDQVQLAVAGALASGPLLQFATSAPNPVSRVSA